MMPAAKVVDVDDRPDLLDLAQEVRETGEARVLHAAGKPLALVIPMNDTDAPTRSSALDDADPPTRPYPWRKKTAADYEAFRSAAGSWRDVDTDRLLEDIYADRRSMDRPPVDL